MLALLPTPLCLLTVTMVLAMILYFIFIVVQVHFSAFSPTPAQNPSPPHLPPISTFPPIIIHVSFIIVPANNLPFPPEISSPLPSGHCQPVLNFSVFGYILLVCFFC